MLDQSAVMHVSILDKYAEPGTVTMNGTKFILGADEGGRDVLGQLIIGARNSILIGFAITIITSIIGVGLGIISGYYGGMIDNILMRIVDFIMILPIMLIIIVFVSVIPKYSIWSFIWIMCAFYWVGKRGCSAVKRYLKGAEITLVPLRQWEQAILKLCFEKLCRI